MEYYKNNDEIFKIRGPLIPDRDEDIYVERNCDKEVLSELKKNQLTYITLLGARQTGKTSLLLMVKKKVSWYMTAYLDLSLLEKIEREEEWYKEFYINILKIFLKEKKINYNEIERVSLKLHLGILDFFEILSRLIPYKKFLIILDEFGTIPTNLSNGFLNALRSYYNQKDEIPYFENTAWIFCGTFIPDDLTKDSKNSPFNVSKLVAISNSTKEGIKKLVLNLEKFGLTVTDNIIDNIFENTQGNLYVTQLLCLELIKATKSQKIISEDLISLLIEEIIHKGDEHLKHVVKKVKTLENSLIKKLLRGEKVSVYGKFSEEAERLEIIAGAIKREGNYYKINNKIYEKIFQEYFEEDEEADKLSYPEINYQDNIVMVNPYEVIIGKNERIRTLKEQIKKFSLLESDILITGETGTGKELVAYEIYKHSGKTIFIPVNCGAIPENLFESEFFGYVKGAFTDAKEDKKGLFEQANEGVIFLDEIQAIPLQLQPKLLRVLETKKVRPIGGLENKKVDVKIIAASSNDLSQMVEKGKFESPLYFRLSRISINLPPLRERKEDIPNLICYFAFKMYIKHNKNYQCIGITKYTLKKIMDYDFPGNIRELEGIIVDEAPLFGDSGNNLILYYDTSIKRKRPLIKTVNILSLNILEDDLIKFVIFDKDWFLDLFYHNYINKFNISKETTEINDLFIKESYQLIIKSDFLINNISYKDLYSIIEKFLGKPPENYNLLNDLYKMYKKDETKSKYLGRWSFKDENEIKDYFIKIFCPLMLLDFGISSGIPKILGYGSASTIKERLLKLKEKGIKCDKFNPKFLNCYKWKECWGEQ